MIDEPTRRLDEGALRALVPRVLAGLVRRGEDFDAAEDALQEALLEALRVWPEHPPRCSTRLIPTEHTRDGRRRSRRRQGCSARATRTGRGYSPTLVRQFDFVGTAYCCAIAVRKTVAFTIACAFALAVVASPAQSANLPLNPPSGASFNTTELPDFTVEYGPDDPPWAIVLSPDDGRPGGMIFPSDDPDYFEVDIGWLATKFNALGRFKWSICDYDEVAMTIVDATCSPPRPFFITFRLTTLTASVARSDARRVFKKVTRFALPRSGVKCRRNSRTKRTCRVGTYLGDSLIYGRVVLWNKRPRGVRTYNLTRYRATLRIYDEYCHLVNNRPRSECDGPYKKRSGWAYQT